MKRNRAFTVFSCVLFLIVSLLSVTAYIISARQINMTHIEQQLTISSETIRLRLASLVNSEISLTLRMANAPAILQHFLDPNDPELLAAAYSEFSLYELHFRDSIIFWINDIDKIFYSTGKIPYIIDPDDPETYWYNLTLHNTERYNLNINYNPDIDEISLWINVPVFDDADSGKPIGMLGTGINLNDFQQFVAFAYKEFDRNITSYIFNKFDEITSAEDYELVFNKTSILEHLGDAGAEITRIAKTLTEEESSRFIYGGNIYLVSYIPAMEWYLAVSHPQPGLLALNVPMNYVFFSMIAIIFIIFIIMNFTHIYSKSKITKQNLQLIEARAKAEAASRAKSIFLANMSHEIRSPLNAVIGLSEIELQGNIENSSREHITQIYKSGSLLLGIINDILDISKIESGNFEIAPAEYDTASLISDALMLNLIKIGSRPIKFLLEISSDFPRTLYGDELRIKQILNNLLSNAIKYTEQGMVKLLVDSEDSKPQRTLSTQRGEEGEEKPFANFADSADSAVNKITFTVIDTGIGIKEEDIEKIFDNYIQLDSQANRSNEGTGLGLAISKNLVKMMGGSISVESEFGMGSCFTVEIPQIIKGNEQIGEETAQLLRNFQYFTQKHEDNIIRYIIPKGKALVVDDLPANLMVAKGLLKPYGLEVDTASSGQEAIKLATNKQYDIIFMDHMMPVMDGMEAAKHIQSPATIIALTANAMRGMKEFYKENGFADFLSKPIMPRQLDDILCRYMPQDKLVSLQDMPLQERLKITNRSFAAEIEAQHLDKLNHYRRSFETLSNNLFEFDAEYFEKFASFIESLKQNSLAEDQLEQADSLLEATLNHDIPQIQERLSVFYENLQSKTNTGSEALGAMITGLKKAIAGGEAGQAGAIIAKIGALSLDRRGRELYFLFYDYILNGDTEKILGAISLWEKLGEEI